MVASILKFLGVAILAVQATSAQCVKGRKYHTINFDDSKEFRVLPRDYQGVTLSKGNWAAHPPYGVYMGYDPKNFYQWSQYSKPSIAEVTSGQKITPGAFGAGPLRVESFSAACVSNAADYFFKPANCSFLVTADDKSATFNYNIAKFKTPKFQHFDAPTTLTGSELSFAVPPQPHKYELYAYVDTIKLSVPC